MDPVNSQYYDISGFNKLVNQSSHTFSVLHLNARSIKNKKENFDVFLDSLAIKFDALTFSETWLTPNNVPQRFAGYTYNGLVRHSGRGGGIAVYVKEQLNHKIIDDLSFISPCIECLVVNVINVIVVMVYRPPAGKKQEFLDYIDTFLQKLHAMRMSF